MAKQFLHSLIHPHLLFDVWWIVSHVHLISNRPFYIPFYYSPKSSAKGSESSSLLPSSGLCTTAASESPSDILIVPSSPSYQHSSHQELMERRYVLEAVSYCHQAHELHPCIVEWDL
jgi:hypothetical protein